MIRVLAAQVNTTTSPEDETVLILNTSPRPIDLTGWALADSQKRKKPLDGTIDAGAARVFHLRPEIELSNKGGIISLLNAAGFKVDGVSYTREQARHPGWTIAFCSRDS